MERTYKLTCIVKCLNPDASPEDFQREIEMFNSANEGCTQVEEVEIQPLAETGA